MSHFGVLSHSGMGHLNPLIALSRMLTARGHEVTFFQKPELEPQLRQQGLGFSSVSGIRSISEKHGQTDESRSFQSNSFALRDKIERIIAEMEISFREAPPALVQAGVDVLLIDEIILSGPTLAQMLNIPYFVVSTSIPLNFGWSVSRQTPEHKNSASDSSQPQNALLHISVFRMRGPVRRKLDDFRRQIGLGPIREMRKIYPALAHIAQLPQCLDFPRSRLPRNFYYTGPFVDESARRSIQFPWHRFDGRHLVYASLGTARAAQPQTLHFIAQACNELNLQLVISLGGRGNPEMFEDLPGQPLVVKDAPQLELLKKADIVISHGGLNTVLETLMEGKPIIAIPIAYDQPAVANRLSWLGVAEVISIDELVMKQIHTALQKLLHNQSYRNVAVDLRDKIRNARGLERAADLIEAALEKRAASHRTSLNDVCQS